MGLISDGDFNRFFGNLVQENPIDGPPRRGSHRSSRQANGDPFGPYGFGNTHTGRRPSTRNYEPSREQQHPPMQQPAQPVRRQYPDDWTRSNRGPTASGGNWGSRYPTQRF
jgi:hypothetical protein